MLHSSRIRTGVCVTLGLAAVLSLSLAGQPPRPIPQIRVMHVTDSYCGVRVLDKGNRHAETLACVASGAHLQLYDRRTGVLYEIQFASEELRIELQNDYAGLEVHAQGLWDDSQGRVKLQSLAPFRDPASRQLRDAE